MGIQQRARHCKLCGRATLHERRTFAATWGCLLTLLTGGLFLAFWLPLVLVQIVTARYRCQTCGLARR